MDVQPPQYPNQNMQMPPWRALLGCMTRAWSQLRAGTLCTPHILSSIGLPSQSCLRKASLVGRASQNATTTTSLWEQTVFTPCSLLTDRMRRGTQQHTNCLTILLACRVFELTFTATPSQFSHKPLRNQRKKTQDGTKTVVTSSKGVLLNARGIMKVTQTEHQKTKLRRPFCVTSWSGVFGRKLIPGGSKTTKTSKKRFSLRSVCFQAVVVESMVLSHKGLQIMAPLVFTRGGWFSICCWLSWFSGSGASDAPTSSFVWESQIVPLNQHLLHGSLDICLGLLPKAPPPPVQTRDSAQVFATQGATLSCNFARKSRGKIAAIWNRGAAAKLQPQSSLNQRKRG